MRKLIFAINTTLDGCVDHTKFYAAEDTTAYFLKLWRDVDTFVFGRKIYELMVPYWPDVAKSSPGQDHNEADIEFAWAFNAIEKIIVFSRSLKNAEGETTRIVGTGLHHEMLRLKQQPGKNIFTGGVTLASQMAALGLIDEYHLVVHPVVVGEGRRLFEGMSLQQKLTLKLAGSTVYKSGAVVLRYVKQ